MNTAASVQTNVFLCEEGGRESLLRVIYGGERCRLLTCAESCDENTLRDADAGKRNISSIQQLCVKLIKYSFLGCPFSEQWVFSIMPC